MGTLLAPDIDEVSTSSVGQASVASAVSAGPISVASGAVAVLAAEAGGSAFEFEHRGFVVRVYEAPATRKAYTAIAVKDDVTLEVGKFFPAGGSASGRARKAIVDLIDAYVGPCPLAANGQHQWKPMNEGSRYVACKPCRIALGGTVSETPKSLATQLIESIEVERQKRPTWRCSCDYLNPPGARRCGHCGWPRPSAPGPSHQEVMAQLEASVEAEKRG